MNDQSSGSTRPRIGVVGPCKSGKSTLVRGLQKAAYEATQIAQEHSFAPRMWQQTGKPTVLIYLHCEYEATVTRGLSWMRHEYEDQQPRLTHARKNADLEINTDSDSPESVLNKVLDFLADSNLIS
ncbi:MAG: hypothetical protein WEA61_09965 [Anaerolineales bacterium]